MFLFFLYIAFVPFPILHAFSCIFLRLNLFLFFPVFFFRIFSYSCFILVSTFLSFTHFILMPLTFSPLSARGEILLPLGAQHVEPSLHFSPSSFSIFRVLAPRPEMSQTRLCFRTTLLLLQATREGRREERILHPFPVSHSRSGKLSTEIEKIREAWSRTGEGFRG